MNKLHNPNHQLPIIIIPRQSVWFQNVVQSELVKVQPTFKKDLLDRVEVFKKDANDYTNDYTNVRIVFLIFGNFLDNTCGIVQKKGRFKQ